MPTVLVDTDVAIDFFRGVPYRKKGITWTSVDCLLMATALERKHKIASRNISHFPEKGLLLNIPSLP